MLCCRTGMRDGPILRQALDEDSFLCPPKKTLMLSLAKQESADTSDRPAQQVGPDRLQRRRGLVRRILVDRQLEQGVAEMQEDRLLLLRAEEIGRAHV